MTDLTREEIDALLNTLSTPGYRPAVANRATDAITQLLAQLDAAEAKTAEEQSLFGRMAETCAHIQDKLDAAEARADAAAYTRTGVFDISGREILVGDRIKIMLDGKHTKQEYHYPEYEVIFKAPNFDLKYCGGGLDSCTGRWCFNVPQKSSPIETVSALPLASPKRGEALHEEPNNDAG